MGAKEYSICNWLSRTFWNTQFWLFINKFLFIINF